ncbi:Protein DEL-7, partial [Aphelenchoides avenae]
MLSAGEIQILLKISKTRFECAFWALLVGVCFALAFWNNKTLLQSYIDNSTRLHYTIKWNRLLHFPNLTICPANPDGLDFDALEADVAQRVGDLPNATKRNLMVFAMAGAGFRYFEGYLKKWNASYVEELSVMFDTWRGNSTTSEFYRFMFEENGLQCEKMFHECVYGSTKIPCCQVFQPMYVALRGRCFRLRMLYQQDLGEAGELAVRLKQLRSPFISANKQMNQYVLHVSDAYPDVRLFPRYYLNRNRALSLHLNAVRYRLFPENQYCSAAEEDQGLGTCFINSWLRTNVIETLNCTLFYMHYKTPHVDVCEPKTVVANYFHVTATSPTEALRSSKISDAQ